MKATFENSVNILVKAYFYGHLNAMSCEACAVGNLVASAKGYTYSKEKIGLFGPEWNESEPAWKYVISFFVDMGEYNGIAKEQIDSTGYTPKQLSDIERVFMLNTKTLASPELDNFDGLMAVVDVLADIHGIDLKAKEEAKALFVKSLNP